MGNRLEGRHNLFAIAGILLNVPFIKNFFMLLNNLVLSLEEAASPSPCSACWAT